jgi:threonine synthase
MMGGILAFHTGLPVAKYIIATNSNDEVPNFFATGKYEKVVPSKVCISNAMNVGHPSNLARLVDLYGGHMDEQGNLHKQPDMKRMRQDIFPVSIKDEVTRDTIGAAYREHKLILEPHGSVGWAGLLHYLETAPDDKNVTAISLETAHPAKFPDEIRAITGIEPPLPPSLNGLEDREERYRELEVSYESFKAFLQQEYGK